MQVIRTIIWVLLTAALVSFIYMNSTLATVRLFPTNNDYVVYTWPVGFIALFFFLAGIVPMWLIHLGHRWRTKRRIASLENAVRAATPTPITASETPNEATEAS